VQDKRTSLLRNSIHRIRCWIQGRFTHDITRYPSIGSGAGYRAGLLTISIKLINCRIKGTLTQEFHPTNQVQVKGKFSLEFHPTNQVQYSVNNLNIPAQGEFG
jgi:hypothetical protein